MEVMQLQQQIQLKDVHIEFAQPLRDASTIAAELVLMAEQAGYTTKLLLHTLCVPAEAKAPTCSQLGQVVLTDILVVTDVLDPAAVAT